MRFSLDRVANMMGKGKVTSSLPLAITYNVFKSFCPHNSEFKQCGKTRNCSFRAISPFCQCVFYRLVL